MNWKSEVQKTCASETIFKNICAFVELVLEYNQKFNLTGFDEQTIWKDGIYQSIKLLDFEIKKDSGFSLLDVGSGCGFPSIPYLIFKDNKFDLTIIESSQKRVNFLKVVKEKLKLKSLTLINQRAEDVKDQTEKFDYVTARAVASLKILLEITTLFGKINSQYFFLKSNLIEQELNEAKIIINNLKIMNLSVKEVDINDDRKHFIVGYIKKHKSPKNFPRKWHQIK